MKRIKTGILLLLTAVLAAGGLFLVLQALNRQQKTLLGQTDIIERREEKQGETNTKSYTFGNGSYQGGRKVGDTDLLIAARFYWDENEWLLHSPLTDQMDQQTALLAGLAGIHRLCELEILPELFLEAESGDCVVSARLQTKRYDRDTHEPVSNLTSMWEITYSLQGSFSLTIDMEAVTGTILEVSAQQLAVEPNETDCVISEKAGFSEFREAWQRERMGTEAFDSGTEEEEKKVENAYPAPSGQLLGYTDLWTVYAESILQENPEWYREDIWRSVETISDSFVNQYLDMNQMEWVQQETEKSIYSDSSGTTAGIVWKSEAVCVRAYGGVIVSIDYLPQRTWTTMKIRTY